MGATWTPESERDTSYYIFKALFLCRVTFIQTLSTDYINLYGFPASGDNRTDQETANELVSRMLTISQMSEYFKEGIIVHVVDYKDTKEIYERISNHLNAWKYKLNNEFNIRDAPLDDLLLLDKLASAVYPHAITIMDTAYVDSLLAIRASNVMSVPRDKILSPLRPKNEIVGGDVASNTKSRISMADVFKREYSTLNKWH